MAGFGGSIGVGQQKGEAVHRSRFGGADVASCFLGPELQIESRVDVAQEDVRARDGQIG